MARGEKKPTARKTAAKGKAGSGKPSPAATKTRKPPAASAKPRTTTRKAVPSKSGSSRSATAKGGGTATSTKQSTASPKKGARARTAKQANVSAKPMGARAIERQIKRLDNSRIKRRAIPAKLKTDKKILHLARTIINLAQREIEPFVDVPTRTLSNVNYSRRNKILEMGDSTQRRSLFNLGQSRKFMQTLVIARGCAQVLREEKTTSIRDLYYMTKHTLGETNENTFEEQEESDPVIEDLEVTLGSLREELHLFAAKRGSVVGPMTLVDSGDTIDLSHMGSGGWAVPGIVEPDIIRFQKHNAKFILMVEKEAVWARLNEDKFWRRHNCILVTGQGQPPRGVRRLLYRMVNELKLPLYIFVDNDPWGYYIHSVVKQGSINLAFESARMAVPTARFVGLSSFDPEKFGISSGVSIRLNDQDRNRAREILDYPWFQQRSWQKEIRHMLAQGVKWELEALSNKGLSFVTEEYLPKKLQDKDWI